MNAVAFSIAEPVRAKFPAIQVAAVRARMEDREGMARKLEELRQTITSEIVPELTGSDPITEHPAIRTWRETYGQMGVKPSKYRSSIEALLRRVARGDSVTMGLDLVDLYNLVSIRMGSPMGAYDASKLNGTDRIDLRLCMPETDAFAPLGADSGAFPLNPDLVVYASNSEVLCWGFNARDSVEVCIDEDSREVIFFSETAHPEGASLPELTIAFLRDVLAEIGAEVGPVVTFDADHPTGEI